MWNNWIKIWNIFQKILIRTVSELIKQIVKEDGLIKGFYKSFSLTIFKIPIGGGIVWSVKNFLNRTIDKRFDFWDKL